MSSDVAIKLENVTKYYKLYDDPKYRLKEALHPFGKKYHKPFYATNNLTLEIKKGEILGVVGKNGSGKSTLLKLITRVLVPDAGTIEISGKMSALLELGSGFNPEFSGLQNISFYGSILGFSKKEIEEKLDDIIVFADIGDFINQPLKTYSSGMKSRLAFAVAAHVDPDILILDEVLAVGDIHFRKKSYEKIKELFDSGKTIIYVSHSLGEISRLCNRAIMIHDGHVLMDGEPKKVVKYYEKYLFAKDENKLTVLEEIQSKSGVETDEQILTINGLEKKRELEKEREINGPSPYYIPDFVSQNIVEYDNTFLKITDAHIETMFSEKVNVLVSNERYIYCYKLHFLADYYGVDFGMQIHNEKGVLISGSKQEKSVDFKSGDQVEIRWEFDCLMHDGVYYTSTGVNHLVEGKREYINRLVDAMVFKVLAVENCCNGLIYLNQSEPEMIYLNNLSTA